MYQSFHEMLADIAAHRNMGGPDGKERLRRILVERYGVKETLTAAAVNHWFNGTRVPSLPTLIAILDALGVHGEDRDAAMRLAASLPVSADLPPEKADDSEAA